jgi:hypothetical protein
MDMFWRWRLAATASRWLRWLGSVWGVPLIAVKFWNDD